MARRKDREKARSLRARGKSYSEIKEVLGISKSTLSGWLGDMPLAPEQIRLLRDLNPRRIENFRATMRKKREMRLQSAYTQAREDIGKLSKRELFIAGLFLYWGEGLKAQRGTVGISNTDPVVILAFLDWLKTMKISKDKLRVRLHLYKDMNIGQETRYWSKSLSIPIAQFRKPYVKDSFLSGLTYKTGHGHGTCNLLFVNIPMWEYITMALRYIREQYARP